MEPERQKDKSDSAGNQVKALLGYLAWLLWLISEPLAYGLILVLCSRAG